MNDMHIKELRIYRAVSKLTKPIADATHDISEIAFYVLEAETGAGVVGQGYLLSFHYSPNAIEGALKDLKKFVEERDYEICQTQDIQMDYESESLACSAGPWLLSMWRSGTPTRRPWGSPYGSFSAVTPGRSRCTAAADGFLTAKKS